MEQTNTQILPRKTLYLIVVSWVLSMVLSIIVFNFTVPVFFVIINKIFIIGFSLLFAYYGVIKFTPTKSLRSMILIIASSLTIDSGFPKNRYINSELVEIIGLQFYWESYLVLLIACILSFLIYRNYFNFDEPVVVKNESETSLDLFKDFLFSITKGCVFLAVSLLMFFVVTKTKALTLFFIDNTLITSIVMVIILSIITSFLSKSNETRVKLLLLAVTMQFAFISFFWNTLILNKAFPIGCYGKDKVEVVILETYDTGFISINSESNNGLLIEEQIFFKSNISPMYRDKSKNSWDVSSLPSIECDLEKYVAISKTIQKSIFY